MDIREFFSYLFAQQTSRELAEQLLDVYRGRASRTPSSTGAALGAGASR
jgi:hypothetical protein